MIRRFAIRPILMRLVFSVAIAGQATHLIAVGGPEKSVNPNALLALRGDHPAGRDALPLPV